MKSTGGNEKYVIRRHRTVFSRYRAAFHNRQEISLDTFTGHIGTMGSVSAGDFIDLIKKDDTGLLHLFDGHPHDFIQVDKALGLFLG